MSESSHTIALNVWSMLKNTYIYVVVESWDKCLRGSQAVKVGVAKNPESRIAELQVANPRKLGLAMLIGPMGSKNAYGLEKAIHRYLKPQHINGEWFRFNAIERLSRFNIPSDIDVKTFHVEQTKTRKALKFDKIKRDAEEQLDREHLAAIKLYG